MLLRLSAPARIAAVDAVVDAAEVGIADRTTNRLG
jgi:hypothetical protein